MYEDKTLVCKECGAEFVFTAGEQEFYASKGFVNEPQRCKACRDARKMPPSPPAKCTRLSALTAAKKRKFPSSPAKIVRYIAANASQREEKWTNFSILNFANFPPKGRKFLSGDFFFPIK